MITNAQKIKYKYLSLCPPDCVAAPWRLPCSSICTHRPCSSTARLFCQGAVMHMLRTVPFTVAVFYSRVARNLLGSREKKCGDDGDDLNTAVGISLPRWSGNAVIVTALISSNFTSEKSLHYLHQKNYWMRVKLECRCELISGVKFGNQHHFNILLC